MIRGGVAVVIGALSLGGCAFNAWSDYRNPIVRQINGDNEANQWAQKTDLLAREPLGGGLEPGQSRGAVAAFLAENDFAPIALEDCEATQTCTDLIDPAGLNYQRQGAMLGCPVAYSVFARFDASDRLAEAIGTRQELICREA
ncbi:MAG: hypothetical protein ACFB2Z_09225 [Maricaulaceae bacterium]